MVSGGRIQSVADQGANGYDLVKQGTGCATATINGVGAAAGDTSASNYLRCVDDPSGVTHIYGVSDSLADTTWIAVGSQSSSYYAGVAQSGSGSTATQSAGTPTYRADGVVVSPSTRGDLYTAWAAQHIFAIEEADLSAFTALALFEYVGGGAYIFAGDYGDQILLTAAPSSTDRQKIEGYLAHKYGLEANLASDHPYKFYAP